VLPPAVERACQMFTADQFRAKAAEFRGLLTNMARSPNETRECRDLEQTYTTLAENEEWMLSISIRRSNGERITTTVLPLPRKKRKF
jgi:hypothetical protein